MYNDWYKVVLRLNDMLKFLLCLTKSLIRYICGCIWTNSRFKRTLKECMEYASIHKVTEKSIYYQNKFKTHQ